MLAPMDEARVGGKRRAPGCSSYQAQTRNNLFMVLLFDKKRCADDRDEDSAQRPAKRK